MRLLRRLVCRFIGHNWNWDEMLKPEHIFALVSGDFPCVRCGFRWRDHRPDLVPERHRGRAAE